MSIFISFSRKNYWPTLQRILVNSAAGVLLVLLSSSYSWAEGLVYQVCLTSNPLQAQVTIDTSSLNDFELTPSRSTPDSKKVAPLILCDGSKIARADKPLPLKCKQISWKINFKKLLGGINAAEQGNLYIDQPKPWWILIEWDNFPRIENHKAQVCAEVGVENDLGIYCKPLPSRQQPPLIMGLGQAQAKYESANFDVNLFGKFNPAQGDVLLAQYAKINKYLGGVIPSEKNEIPWDLIWLPVEKSSGSLGGAAGYHSFVANYPVNDGQWTEQSVIWLLKISAHETVHALSKLDNPVWAEESLAEYYAFKAITALGLNGDSPLVDWEMRAGKIPHANRGLYYAEQQVALRKDMSFYPLLYVKGAAFWHELDVKLQNQGESLDEYITLLDGLVYDEGQLPEQFEAALKASLTPSVWDKIKKEYLL